MVYYIFSVLELETHVERYLEFQFKIYFALDVNITVSLKLFMSHSTFCFSNRTEATEHNCHINSKCVYINF